MNPDIVHLFLICALIILLGIFYISPIELKVDEDEDDD